MHIQSMLELRKFVCVCSVKTRFDCNAFVDQKHFTILYDSAENTIGW